MILWRSGTGKRMEDKDSNMLQLISSMIDIKTHVIPAVSLEVEDCVQFSIVRIREQPLHARMQDKNSATWCSDELV